MRFRRNKTEVRKRQEKEWKAKKTEAPTRPTEQDILDKGPKQPCMAIFRVDMGFTRCGTGIAAATSHQHRAIVFGWDRIFADWASGKTYGNPWEDDEILQSDQAWVHEGQTP